MNETNNDKSTSCKINPEDYRKNRVRLNHFKFEGKKLIPKPGTTAKELWDEFGENERRSILKKVEKLQHASKK